MAKKNQAVIKGLVDTAESISQEDPNIILKLSSEELTFDYVMRNGFTKPVLVEDPKGLDMVVPNEKITIHDILEYVGADRVITPINVWTQQERKMTLKKFTEYFLSNNRREIFNLLSLQLSDTQLKDLVQAPLLVRDLDWSVNLLPKRSSGSWKYNKVQNYCLIGMKGSYTDFHIDFGGTSVWNHVVKGEKVFYLIEPTFYNLSVFKYWFQVDMKNRNCLAENVRNCYKVTIKAGGTLFLPSGWIHAVYTPEDTIVFAGNFLHYHCIKKQLEVFEIERLQKTTPNFSYPGFKELHWYAAAELPLLIKNLRRSSIKLPNHLVEGAKYLLSTLYEWIENMKRITRDTGTPDNINVNEVIYNLQALTEELQGSEIPEDVDCIVVQATTEELQGSEIPEDVDCIMVQATTEELQILPDDNVPELQIVNAESSPPTGDNQQDDETDANPLAQDSSMSDSPVVLLQNPHHKCNYGDCTYESKDLWKMNRHVMRHHENIRPYICQWCNFASSDEWHLQRHHGSQHHGHRRRHRMKLREQ